MCAKKHSSGNKSTPRWCHKGPSQRVMSQDLSQVGANTLVRCWLRPPPSLFFVTFQICRRSSPASHLNNSSKQRAIFSVFLEIWCFTFFVSNHTLCKVARREARVRNRGWNYLTLNRQYNRTRNHQFKKCGVKGRTGLPEKFYYGERAPPPDQWLNIFIFYISVHLKQACPGYGPRAKCDPPTDESGPRPVSENTFLVAATRYWIKHADFAISPFTPQRFHAASETEPGPECDLRGVGPRVFSLYLFFLLFF